MRTIRNHLCLIALVAAGTTPPTLAGPIPGGEFHVGPDTLHYGHYEMIGGVPHAVLGETWTFDHGGGDPLEGWTVEDLTTDPAAYFRVITAASWMGHQNPEDRPEINPSGTAWLGLFEDEADALCYANGLGYGNLWSQRITSPLFSLTGSGDLTLRFNYYSQLYAHDETDQEDHVQVKLVFPNGSTLDVGPRITGIHGVPELDQWESASIVVPAASLTGQTQARVRFEMRSDRYASDEDAGFGFDASLAPFAFAHFSAERAATRLVQYFDHTLPLAPNQFVNGSQTPEELGKCVCVFDVNMDGFDDVIVGDAQYSNGQSKEGRVLAYYGNSNGIVASTPSWSYEPNVAQARFGSSIAAGYSGPNDTAPMILIGAPYLSNGQTTEGGIYLFTSDTGGIHSSPDWSFESNVTGARLGWSVSCGDFTNDDIDDLAAGAPYFTNGQSAEGRIYGWKLIDIWTAPTWTAESDQVNSYLGTNVKVVEDPGVGGYVIAGMSLFDGANGIDCGAVEVLDGLTGSVVGVPVLGAQAGSQLGQSVAEIGDVDGLGGVDFAVTEAIHTTLPAVVVYTSGGIGELDVYSVLEHSSFAPDIASALHQTAQGTGEIVMYSLFNNTTIRLLDIVTPTPGTWKELWSLAIPSMAPSAAMAATGDIDNDGGRDLVFGMPGYNGLRGRVQVHLRRDTDDAGWLAEPIPAMGHEVGTAAASAYTLPGGACGFSGNVLELHDATQQHPQGQHVRMLSPVVAPSSFDAETFVVKGDGYWDGPWDAEVFMNVGWTYYPWTCPLTGQVGWSPPGWLQPENFFYGVSGCWDIHWDSADSQIRNELAGAQKVRAYIDLWASCEAVGFTPDYCPANFPGPNNESPLFDNLWIGAVAAPDISGQLRNQPLLFDCSQFGSVVPNTRLELYNLDDYYDSFYSWTDDAGRFAFHGVPQDDGATWDIRTPGDPWCTVCPVPFSYILGQPPITNLLVGFRACDTVTDLAVALAGAQAKPGFQTTYGITCTNPGTVAASAPLTLQLPWEVSFTSCSGGGSYNSSMHRVEWTSVEVQPLASKVHSVQGLVDTSTPLGATLVSSVDYGPPSGDSRVSNNHDTCTQTVVGALDPNDKQVSPTGAIPQGQLLTYQINFQNVGTAAATNVRIEDTLDGDLDLASVTFDATSHAPTSVTVNDRTLIWRFDGIELPDSTSNEPGSHGFVTFTARPLANLPPGQEITNGARIYFDFAQPVPTNVVTNTIETPSGVETQTLPRTFDLSLRGAMPARVAVNLELALPSRGKLSVRVYDVAGRLTRSLASTPVEAGAVRLRWDRMDEVGRAVPAGIYFVRAEWTGADQRADRTARLVIIE